MRLKIWHEQFDITHGKESRGGKMKKKRRQNWKRILLWMLAVVLFVGVWIGSMPVAKAAQTNGTSDIAE